jgi:hypothetical protein
VQQANGRTGTKPSARTEGKETRSISPDEPGRLFDIGADTANKAHDESENYQALGIATELEAAARLIRWAFSANQSPTPEAVRLS